LDFIKEGRNVILAGNAGTGKTHISIGLGIQACMEGYRVWFTTIPLLINQIKECRSQRTLRAFQNRFEKYDLVIADEMGYISFDKEGAELLFTHLCRYGQIRKQPLSLQIYLLKGGERYFKIPS
jgi:DNA replication protein DnaC